MQDPGGKNERSLVDANSQRIWLRLASASLVVGSLVAVGVVHNADADHGAQTSYAYDPTTTDSDVDSTSDSVPAIWSQQYKIYKPVTTEAIPTASTSLNSTTTTTPNTVHKSTPDKNQPIVLDPKQAALLPAYSDVGLGSAFKEYLSGTTDPSTLGGPWPAPNNPWRTSYIEREPLNGRTAHIVAHRLEAVDSSHTTYEQFYGVLDQGPAWDTTSKFFGEPGVSVIASHDITKIVDYPVDIQGKEYNEDGAGYNNDAIRPGDELVIWVTTPDGGSRAYVYENMVDPALAANEDIVDDNAAGWQSIHRMPANVDPNTNVLRIYMCFPQWESIERKIFTYKLKDVVIYKTAQTNWP